jgi:hypothetical protein
MRATKEGWVERLTPADEGIAAAKHDTYMSLLVETTEKRINEMWSARKGMIDWLHLEQFMSDVLSSELSDTDKVSACREALDAVTRRGHFDPSDYFKKS